MSNYTRVNWVDGSGGGTPMDAANLNVMDAGVAASVRQDGSTPMTATQLVTSPDQLASGHQETGVVGFQFVASASGQQGGYMVNFKTVMTHAPSSITLTVGFSLNFTGLTADAIGIYGFRFTLQAVTAGFCQWIGSYVTVGNCVLAVDALAQTFDHHCEACGHVSRAVPVSALQSASAPIPSLLYACPACGATEAFNCGLTAADEADTSPQGSGEYATTRGAQATLIRQLLALLNLPLA